jgi:mono/diheme cytochrome c family protein
LVASFLLPGCDMDSYSPAIKYLVRSDPLVLDAALGPDRYEPDRPGVLPLFSLKDLQDPRNPLHDRTDVEKKLLDPTKMDPAARKELEELLNEYFGTPASPKVGDAPPEVVTSLRLDQETLVRGSSLYRIHCLHCHGVSGDGRGPTARWVNPHPRDYRLGRFKFQSTDQRDTEGHPRREDLMRTLRQGIEGTSMPSFGLLPQDELEALASYVVHLSMRGEMEAYAIRRIYYDENAKQFLPPGVDDDGRTSAEQFKGFWQSPFGVAKRWHAAQAKPIEVKAAPSGDAKEMKDSVRRGQALFLADEGIIKSLFPGIEPGKIEEFKKASCVSCHIDYGRRALFKYDSWGTMVRPTDLTKGVLRGGRRPIDIYYRVHSGINGSGMPQFAKTLIKDRGKDQPPDDQAIWDIVNFVQALPYPAMRQKYGVAID